MICPVGERARVLWITKGLGPGGAERLLVAFAQCDANERHALHAAYLLPWKDQLVPVLERSGVRVELLAGGRVWDPRWLWRLHRLLRRERIDVVLANAGPVVSEDEPTFVSVSRPEIEQANPDDANRPATTPSAEDDERRDRA